MKIAIIGTGGVGGYFGGMLARAGYDVTFLARGEHLNALRTNGLSVKSICGDFNVYPINATDDICSIGTVDFALIAVKAWQISIIIKELSKILTNDSIVIPLQNGITHVDELIEQISPNYIIGGVCRIMSKIDSPGVINHFGINPSILIGELTNKKTNRISEVKNIFDSAKIDSIITNDITSEMWRKFIPICVSGLLAIHNTVYGELRDKEETRQIMIDLLNEVLLLSQRIGINLETDFIEQTIQSIDSLPFNSTSSLTRDVLAGRQSEIEYQNGAVVKLAEKYGIETPINKFIYNCILPMEIKARK